LVGSIFPTFLSRSLKHLLLQLFCSRREGSTNSKSDVFSSLKKCACTVSKVADSRACMQSNGRRSVCALFVAAGLGIAGRGLCAFLLLALSAAN